jgi:hypothetical protein
MQKVVIRIKFNARTKKENNLLLLFVDLILFCLAIIIIKEIQNVREIRINDIES